MMHFQMSFLRWTSLLCAKTNINIVIGISAFQERSWTPTILTTNAARKGLPTFPFGKLVPDADCQVCAVIFMHIVPVDTSQQSFSQHLDVP